MTTENERDAASRLTLEYILFCAFNGFTPDTAPPAWARNMQEMDDLTQAAWSRVVDAARTALAASAAQPGVSGGEAPLYYEKHGPDGFMDTVKPENAIRLQEILNRRPDLAAKYSLRPVTRPLATPPAETDSKPFRMQITPERLMEKIQADPDDAEVEVRPAAETDSGATELRDFRICYHHVTTPTNRTTYPMAEPLLTYAEAEEELKQQQAKGWAVAWIVGRDGLGANRP